MITHFNPTFIDAQTLYERRFIFSKHLNQIYKIMENYNTLINSSEVSIIEFYAPWCSHCQHMMPIIDRVKASLKGRIDLHTLDIDKHQDTADRLNIDSTPTFLIYHNGKEVWRHVGEIDGDALIQQAHNALK